VIEFATSTMSVPGIGTLIVDPSDGLHLEPVPGVPEAEIDGFLRGGGRARQLQLQRRLPLHVAAVTRDGEAIGFVGPPGLGKSSLAAALSARGWRYVTDDIAPVAWTPDGAPLLEPNPAHVRLWGTSVRALGWPVEESQRILDADKFTFDLPERFVDEPVPLETVYVVRESAEPGIRFEEVVGHARFATFLHGAAFNAEFLESADERRWLFEQTLRLAQRVRVVDLHVPAAAPLAQRADAVLAHLARRP